MSTAVPRQTPSTITVTPAWNRAYIRGLAHGIKPTRLADGTYRVESATEPGAAHHVYPDQAGEIMWCSCSAWMIYQASLPCWHAAIVRAAEAYRHGQSIAVASAPTRLPQVALPEDEPVPSPSRGKSQIYRTEGFA